MSHATCSVSTEEMPSAPLFSARAASLPASFLCPILHECFKDPVVAADGFSYERAAIERWFRESGLPKRSPMTNADIEIVLIPNFALRSAIEAYREEAPMRAREEKDLQIAIETFQEEGSAKISRQEMETRKLRHEIHEISKKTLEAKLRKHALECDLRPLSTFARGISMLLMSWFRSHGPGLACIPDSDVFEEVLKDARLPAAIFNPALLRREEVAPFSENQSVHASVQLCREYGEALGDGKGN